MSWGETIIKPSDIISRDKYSTHNLVSVREAALA